MKRYCSSLSFIAVVVLPILLMSGCSQVRQMRASGVKAASATNLMHIGLAISQYKMDKKVFPPMQNARVAANALASVGYLKNTAVLVHPVTGQAYLPNPTLSGKRSAPIKGTILFYEPLVNPDGTRGVLFLDSSVQFLPNATWLKLKKAAGITSIN